MEFEIVGSIGNVELIAAGLPSGAMHLVELHWYQAHGIGRRDLKIKRYLDE
jgi:hypothetical protein